MRKLFNSYSNWLLHWGFPDDRGLVKNDLSYTILGKWVKFLLWLSEEYIYKKWPKFHLFSWIKLNLVLLTWLRGFPGSTMVKTLPANAGDEGDSGSIPGVGRSPGGGNGNPPQYCCLDNSMDRGAWWATVRGITKSRMCLSMHSCTHTTWFGQFASLVSNLF